MSAITFLGLARKAGKLEYGDDSVAIAARAGKAKVILTSDDAGRNTLVRAENSAAAAGCPVVVVPRTKEQLGAALGRGAVSVATITDIGFASAFIDKLSAETPGLDHIRAELDRLSERAEQRKREMRRHEQKLRHKKYRKNAPQTSRPRARTK